MSTTFLFSILLGTLLMPPSHAPARGFDATHQSFQTARAALTSFCKQRGDDANCQLALESLAAPTSGDRCSGSVATQENAGGFFQLRCPSTLVFGVLDRQQGFWRPMKVSAFRLYRSTTREYAQANDAFLHYCKTSGDSSCSELLALWDRCPPGEYSVGAAGYRMLAKECPEKVAFIDFQQTGDQLTVSRTQVVDRDGDGTP